MCVPLCVSGVVCSMPKIGLIQKRCFYSMAFSKNVIVVITYHVVRMSFRRVPAGPTISKMKLRFGGARIVNINMFRCF